MSQNDKILPFKITEHAVGVVLKEAVRRAIGIIRSQMLIFNAQVKEGCAGEMNDVVTSADTAAQNVYL